MTLFEISYSQKNVNELVDKAIQYAVKGDYKNAIIIFDAAAKKNSPYAYHTLGQYYEFGLGCEQNLKKSLSFFEKAQIHGFENSDKDIERIKQKIKGMDEASVQSENKSNNPNQSINNSQINCDDIINITASQKPVLNTFLAGVKHAIITQKPLYNNHIPAFNALIKFLKAMGFESVQYYDDKNLEYENVCEVVDVQIGFSHSQYKYIEVKWIFTSRCLNYSWELESNQSAITNTHDGGENNFYNLLRSMYGYKKPTFDSYWTLKNAYKKTCWTENEIKRVFKNNGCSKFEGIYENTSSTTAMPRYKIGVRKIDGQYNFIYLSGFNQNSSTWEEGDIKAILQETATPNFYKADWYMADKSIDNEYYVSFEEGFFNLLNAKSEKTLFVKLFPSVSDNINTPSYVKSSGSGFAISTNGYIVTNYHVIEDAQKIRVRGVNGDFTRAYSAKVIKNDKENDLSIIKIDDPYFTSCGKIPYTINNLVSEVGTSVFVLGFPLRSTMGDEIKLTNGIISSKSGFQGDINAYQMSAPIQPGNSGGPMFDKNGNLIGIVNAKHEGAENVSYAIKSTYLLELIESLANRINLPNTNQLSTKTLTEQVKSVKRFTYIIEIN